MVYRGVEQKLFLNGRSIPATNKFTGDRANTPALFSGPFQVISRRFGRIN